MLHLSTPSTETLAFTHPTPPGYKCSPVRQMRFGAVPPSHPYRSHPRLPDASSHPHTKSQVTRKDVYSGKYIHRPIERIHTKHGLENLASKPTTLTIPVFQKWFGETPVLCPEYQRELPSEHPHAQRERGGDCRSAIAPVLGKGNQPPILIPSCIPRPED